MFTEDLLPQTQCDFRQSIFTSDMIFVARQTLEKCRDKYKDLYVWFYGLSKAFDTVDRTLLWETLWYSGCPHKFTNLIRLLHDDMEAQVKVLSLEAVTWSQSSLTFT